MFFSNTNAANVALETTLQASQNTIFKSLKRSGYHLQFLLVEKMSKKIAIISLMLLSLIATVVIYKQYLKSDGLPKKIPNITNKQARDSLIAYKKLLIPAYYKPYKGFTLRVQKRGSGLLTENDNMPIVYRDQSPEGFDMCGNLACYGCYICIDAKAPTSEQWKGLCIPLDADDIRDLIRTSEQFIAQGASVKLYTQRVAILKDALSQIDKINRNFETLLKSTNN